ASQIASVTLPGDTLASVAVLMPDLKQIWIYRNNGDGTFAAPSSDKGTMIYAGNDPSGIAVATIAGQPALLVGNSYGDLLTLLYGNGTFAPDPTTLQNAPLAVGTTTSGKPFAVVADQNTGEVSLFYRIPGTTQFTGPIAINPQTPLLAPGAVQMFSVKG